MSRQSEEVLLIVNHVKNKKTDGVLYMMGERMAWMQSSKQSFQYSHAYADIKAQKISPDTKEKVQLQIVMHDGSANTFHYNHPGGRGPQLKDRDDVKELLQQLLPKFRRKLSNELEEKNRLLQDNPELFQLYKDLVVSQVITAEEFWATQGPKYTSGEKGESKQTTGVSAAFLADIKPETDGCNGLKYNLTADIIESIFRTYPMVKKKHAEYVPHEMSEAEFWKRFFQSHYFHRDRTVHSSKDLFSECAKKDDEEIKSEVERKNTDPLLDLTAHSDNTLDEGYGGTSDDKKSAANPTNLTIIRRFNHHSTMVLKACEQNSLENSTGNSLQNGDDQTQNGPKVTNGETSTQNKTEDQRDDPPRKKARIREKIQMEDLDSQTNSKTLNLRLSRMERYLHGPTPVTSTRYTSSEDLISATNLVSAEVDDWNPDLTHNSNRRQLLQMTNLPGMQRVNYKTYTEMVPEDIQNELKNQYCALCELLRHFWACFPTSSKFLEEKVIKMKSTLERFHMAKLNQLKEQLQQSQYSLDLTNHMQELLTTAYSKFETWQARRNVRKT